MTEPRSAHIERTLKRCALEVHHTGQLRLLAKRMYVSPKVFSYWIKKGHVPKLKADWLQEHFPAIVDATTLTD